MLNLKIREVSKEQRIGKDTSDLLTNFMNNCWMNRYGKLEDGFDIEIIVSSGCNLKCAGCDHFAPVSKEWFVTPEEVREQLSVLVSRLPMIKNIFLMGGEPLLNPYFTEICKVVHDIHSDANIVVYTNGILVDNLTIDELDVLKNTNTSLMITRYPIDLDYNKAKKHLDDNMVCNNYNYTKFLFSGYLVNPEGTEDPNQFYTCTKTQHPVITLKDSKLYACPFSCCSSQIHDFNDKIIIPETDNDYLDIYNVTVNQLEEFCMKPKNKCKYCKEDYRSAWLWRKFDFKDKNNYLYGLKEYFLYDYKRYLKMINNKKFVCNVTEDQELMERLDIEFYKHKTHNFIKRYKKSKFDIIIPFYKITEQIVKQLEETLTSQTIINDCTIYLVSDGDPNEGEVFDYFDNHHILNCVLLKNIHRQGPGVARNQALQCCYGEYVYFLDADDRFAESDTLEKIYAFAKAEQADVITNSMSIEHAETDVCNCSMMSRSFYRRLFLEENNIVFPPLYFGEDGYFNMLVKAYNPKFAENSYLAYIYNKKINDTPFRKDVSDDDIRIYELIYYFCLAAHIDSMDLTKLDNKYYDNVFQKLLGNQLVLEDINIANIEKVLGCCLWLSGRFYERFKEKLSEPNDISLVSSLIYSQILADNYSFTLDGNTTYELDTLEQKIILILGKNEHLMMKSSLGYLRKWL